ncbi:uncharacterized protein AAG666_011145 isoform 2-T3 [Megaptera novaeangliae]
MSRAALRIVQFQVKTFSQLELLASVPGRSCRCVWGESGHPHGPGAARGAPRRRPRHRDLRATQKMPALPDPSVGDKGFHSASRESGRTGCPGLGLGMRGLTPRVQRRRPLHTAGLSGGSKLVWPETFHRRGSPSNMAMPANPTMPFCR